MSTQLQSSSTPESADLIQDFLHTCHSGVLATADSTGKPHAATVYFSLQDDFSLTFITKTQTQKYKNIQANNRVAFVCYDEKAQTTVQITGHTDPVTDPDEQQTAFSATFNLSASISQREYPPIEKLYAGDYTVLRIVPELIKMAVFARPDSEGYDSFETLTFTSH